MKDLFETSAVEEVKGRVAQLRPDSERLWGTMNAAQVMAHCSVLLEVAVGLRRLPRSLVGRVVGRFVKPTLLNEEPLRRNMPTDKNFVVGGERDFVVEQQRLRELINRFATGGPDGCGKNPHSFFGPMTPTEWARMMYKHLDHHLRQFGV